MKTAKSQGIKVTLKLKGGDKVKKQLNSLAAYLQEYVTFLDRINSLTLQARDQLTKLLKKATQTDKFFDWKIEPESKASLHENKKD